MPPIGPDKRASLYLLDAGSLEASRRVGAMHRDFTKDRAALHASEPLRNRSGIEAYTRPDAERRDSPSFRLFEDSDLRNI